MGKLFGRTLERWRDAQLHCSLYEWTFGLFDLSSDVPTRDAFRSVNKRAA